MNQQIIECSTNVIEHSSVNVRLMLNNILRQKVGNSSECSQLEEYSTNMQRTHLECSPNIPRT